MQIDVLEKVENQEVMKCSLFADGRAVRIFMHCNDYKRLMEDVFFIRDGKTKDSADVINTTLVYKPINEKKLNQSIHN